MMKWTALLGVLIAPAAMAQAPAPAATPAPIPVELNKLEPLTPGPGCRAYFVVSNPDTNVIEQLRIDLILFGTDGVIARRLAFDLSPLAPKKTAVRLFDLTGVPCDGISRMLVNDVLLCKEAGPQPAVASEDNSACLDRLTLSSRMSVPLQK